MDRHGMDNDNTTDMDNGRCWRLGPFHWNWKPPFLRFLKRLIMNCMILTMGWRCDDHGTWMCTLDLSLCWYTSDVVLKLSQPLYDLLGPNYYFFWAPSWPIPSSIQLPSFRPGRLKIANANANFLVVVKEAEEGRSIGLRRIAAKLVVQARQAQHRQRARQGRHGYKSQKAKTLLTHTPISTFPFGRTACVCCV